jgi:hypothetical protein
VDSDETAAALQDSGMARTADRLARMRGVGLWGMEHAGARPRLAAWGWRAKTTAHATDAHENVGCPPLSPRAQNKPGPMAPGTTVGRPRHCSAVDANALRKKQSV